MIENIFPTKIYKTTFDGDLASLKEKLLPRLVDVWAQASQDNQASMRGDGECSFNTVRDLETWEEAQPLISFLKTHLMIYWAELGYQDTPVVSEMWANRYGHGSYIDWHDHSPTTITVSFYLQKPPDSGNIVFENPLATLLKYQPFISLASGNRIKLYQNLDHEVPVNEGDLVFFPGYLKHKTLVNQEHTDRIIIGANIFWQA